MGAMIFLLFIPLTPGFFGILWWLAKVEENGVLRGRSSPKLLRLRKNPSLVLTCVNYGYIGSLDSEAGI